MDTNNKNKNEFKKNKINKYTVHMFNMSKGRYLVSGVKQHK